MGEMALTQNSHHHQPIPITTNRILTFSSDHATHTHRRSKTRKEGENRLFLQDALRRFPPEQLRETD